MPIGHSQYVTLIKYHNQLKIGYKLLKRHEMILSNQFSFSYYNEKMPDDVTFKLNNWQRELDRTFLCALSTTQEQMVIAKDQQDTLRDYHQVSLNSEFNVGIKKNILLEEIAFFNKTSLDFLYSPFHILNLYLDQNPCNNQLLILLIDNKFYSLVLDASGRIVDHGVKELTSFDSIKKTNFYDNEVICQKLFDEIYYFELDLAIKDSIQQFYTKQSDIFVEKILILYTLKQLETNHIDHLKEDIAIPLKYHPISIDEYLFELSKHKENYSKSFILPRKKETKKIRWYVSSGVILLIATLALVYYIGLKGDGVNDQSISPTSIDQTLKDKTVLSHSYTVLPNHITTNRIRVKELLNLFDVIPYDVLLKEVVLRESDSVLEVTLLKEDRYLKSMQLPLEKLYEKSSIEFENPNALILNSVIINRSRFPVMIDQDNIQPSYIDDHFLDETSVQEQLEFLFPDNAIIKFESQLQSDLVIYNYRVNLMVKSPTDFFEMIEEINQELYSMHIGYPIMLRQRIDTLEVEFTLQFYQNIISN